MSLLVTPTILVYALENSEIIKRTIPNHVAWFSIKNWNLFLQNLATWFITAIVATCNVLRIPIFKYVQVFVYAIYSYKHLVDSPFCKRKAFSSMSIVLSCNPRHYSWWPHQQTNFCVWCKVKPFSEPINRFSKRLLPETLLKKLMCNVFDISLGTHLYRMRP